MAIDLSRRSLRHEAYALFHSTYISMVKCEDAILSEMGLSPARFGVLLALELLDDPVTQKDVAKFLDRKTNSISLIIDRMEADGFVERIRDMPDRRSLRLKMTSKGIELFEQAVDPMWDFFVTIMSDFSKEEQWTIVGLLKRFRKNCLEFLRSKNSSTSIPLVKEKP